MRQRLPVDREAGRVVKETKKVAEKIWSPKTKFLDPPMFGSYN
jgi:hypothetical protein